MKAATNSIDQHFTAFVPPDAILFPMPAYAQDKLFFNTTLLKYVRAHSSVCIINLLFGV
jgi:hypothetical protein